MIRRAVLLAPLLILPALTVAQNSEPDGRVATAAQPPVAAPVLGECLNEADIRDAVQARRVVPQVTALRAARAERAGEAVRARLCKSDRGLVYAITGLRRDGKVTRILVDASSGKVINAR